MRRTLLLYTGILLAGMACLVLMLDRSSKDDGGFAIYLTEADVPPDQMPALNRVEIAERPLLTMDDIITYNAQSHELEITASAYEEVSGLEVPVTGRSFVACVGGEPIYRGAFWISISSISFDGITILQPSSSQGTRIITLGLGYPSPSFFAGEDTRNDPEVIRSFEDAGKLITGLSIEDVDELPDSMKGYELYSWQQDGEWHFALITGTNRDKSIGEITSEEDMISGTGWVHIHVAGVDSMKSVLAKVPEGEEVLWLSGLRGSTPEDFVDITLPDDSIRDDICEFALKHGIKLSAVDSVP